MSRGLAQHFMLGYFQPSLRDYVDWSKIHLPSRFGIRNGSRHHACLRILRHRARLGAVGVDAEGDDQIDDHRDRLTMDGGRSEMGILDCLHRLFV